MLQIEINFIAEVKDVLNLDEFNRIKKALNQGKATRLRNTLKLAAIASAAIRTFKTDEFKQRMQSAGVNWTIAEFSENVFGFQRSFLYKLLRASELPTEMVEKFIEQSTIEDSVSLAELLKYANSPEAIGEDTDGEAETETEEAAEKPTQVLKVTYTQADGKKLSISVMSDNTAKVNGEKTDINKIIEILKAL